MVMNDHDRVKSHTHTHTNPITYINTHLCLHTYTYTHTHSLTNPLRFESVTVRGPWLNTPWVVVSVGLLALNALAAVLSVVVRGADMRGPFIPTWPGYAFWVALLGWGLLGIVCVDELVKAVDRKYHRKLQKYLKVVFDTRLGMWSPK